MPDDIEQVDGAKSLKSLYNVPENDAECEFPEDDIWKLSLASASNKRSRLHTHMYDYDIISKFTQFLLLSTVFIFFTSS